MALPSPDTPLYNHPLPDIERWLVQRGCAQDPTQLHHWQIERPGWTAELALEIETITVRYSRTNSDRAQSIQRSFKYSLSRQDLDEVIFSGP